MEEKIDNTQASVETDIMRLVKPGKRRLKSLIFSRLFVVLVLILLQLGILFSFFAKYSDYLTQYRGVMATFSFLMVIYLFSCNMDSSAKLTWMMLISIAPIPGALFLAFTKTEVGHRMVRRRLLGILGETKETLKEPEGVLEQLEHDRSGIEDMHRYINRSGCFPIYDDTEVTYFPSGEAKFEAMLTEIKKAKQYIYMEYFIIEEGYMWGKILNLLAKKAAEGVDVRVMYDGMCEISVLPPDYPVRMKKQGIKCKSFSPITPLVSTHYNYRDHRKILAIDGQCAFTGGVNLADEYINKKERFGHWKDTAIMLKGSAAESFALMFLQMWNVTEHDDITKNCDYMALIRTDNSLANATKNMPLRNYMSGSVNKQASSKGFVMPYGDNPFDDDKVGENIYINILYTAKDYVHIMTPYLILDGELENALKFAAERGVDVKIILPGVPDKKMAYALAKSHYRELIKSGVEIYEYTPGFVHAKVFVSDDEKAVVGTINLDYRSLYHHFECAAFMFKTPCIADIYRDYEETLASCSRVTLQSIKKEKLYYKIMGPIMKFVAPLM